MDTNPIAKEVCDNLIENFTLLKRHLNDKEFVEMCVSVEPLFSDVLNKISNVVKTKKSENFDKPLKKIPKRKVVKKRAVKRKKQNI